MLLHCDRSRVIVTDHVGKTIKAYCLPAWQRQQFLEHWSDAWEIIVKSPLAQSAAQNNRSHAIAYLWDEATIDGQKEAQHFKFLVTEMLALHKLDANNLDIHQITELLFSSGDGDDGLLLKIQFPALPPKLRGKESTGDGNPYIRLLAMLSMRDGDWLKAQQTLETIPYDQVIELCAELEENYSKQSQSLNGKPEPPSPSIVTQTELENLDAVREQALSRYFQAQNQAKASAGMDAIMELARQKNGSLDSTNP